MVLTRSSLLSLTCCYCAASLALPPITEAFTPVSAPVPLKQKKGDKREEGRGDRRRRASRHPPFRGGSVGGGVAVAGLPHRQRDDFSSRLGFEARQQQLEVEDHMRSEDAAGHLNGTDAAAEYQGEDYHSEGAVHDRRRFMHALVTSTAAFAVGGSTSPSSDATSFVPAAQAYETNFPVELEFDSARNLSTVRDERISVQKAKVQKTKDEFSSAPLGIRSEGDIAGSALWAAALWLLAGSRSNPATTPLANLIYDADEEANHWLKDRNDGFFAAPPPPLLAVLSMLFIALGVAADRTVYFLAEGDSTISLELAGVTLIGGAALEIGRIATGEKKDTRQQSDRTEELGNEFSNFTDRRLLPGGNCHRSDIVRAFRRFNPKYRRADDLTYPLADIEIERLARDWNRNRGGTEMTAAGFFSGFQVDDQADASIFR